jgi:hypothetical protein
VTTWHHNPEEKIVMLTAVGTSNVAKHGYYAGFALRLNNIFLSRALEKIAVNQYFGE